jgi:hypothetical protein
MFKFSKYYASLTAQQKRDLALGVHSSMSYLGMIAHGKRRPSERFAAALSLAAGKKFNYKV